MKRHFAVALVDFNFYCQFLFDFKLFILVFNLRLSKDQIQYKYYYYY